MFKFFYHFHIVLVLFFMLVYKFTSSGEPIVHVYYIYICIHMLDSEGLA